MPSPAQKRTVLLIVVVIVCTLLVIHHSNPTHIQSTIQAVQQVLHWQHADTSTRVPWPMTKSWQHAETSTRVPWPMANPIPDSASLKQRSLSTISQFYFRYVNILQVFCPMKEVYGGVRGGWYTCAVVRGPNPKPCVAYMIRSKEDRSSNSFFKELKMDYGCEKNFIAKGPATTPNDAAKLQAIQSKGDIDFMVIDTSGNETNLIDWMLTKKLLMNVKQLFVSFHGITVNSYVDVYMQHLDTLRDLFREGFRIFHFQRHVECLFQGEWRKTGCYSLYMMREMTIKGPMDFPTNETINIQPITQLTASYHKYLMTTQVLCKEVIRVGNMDDGGWDVCNDTEWRPSSPCLVYSFGVAHDWTFDDEVSKIYGCEVHSFDPSIGREDHKRSDKITFHNLGLWGNPRGKKGKWNMMNLEGIIKMLGHTNRIIDILKMDIEASEWIAIPHMLSSGVGKNIRQLDFEFHGKVGPNESYRSKWQMLRGIYDHGFRLFWSHPNIKGGNPTVFPPTGRLVDGCYENYYLNLNLKK